LPLTRILIHSSFISFYLFFHHYYYYFFIIFFILFFSVNKIIILIKIKNGQNLGYDRLQPFLSMKHTIDRTQRTIQPLFQASKKPLNKGTCLSTQHQWKKKTVKKDLKKNSCLKGFETNLPLCLLDCCEKNFISFYNICCGILPNVLILVA